MPEDVERNRRIDPEEEQRIVEVLRARREAAHTPESQAEAEGLCLMLQFALRTAMRMREIYTLTLDQISLEQRSIFLGETKNGDRRVVPLNRAARKLLRTPLAGTREGAHGRAAASFLGKSVDAKVLAKTTSDLCRRFRKVF